MAAARYDLVIDQGSDYAVEFTVSENNTVKNLTGYSARAQMRPSKTSSTVTATFNCQIPTGSDGKITMSLTNTASAAIAAGTYHYDLEIFTANNDYVSRLLFGTATVTQEVTR